MPIYPFSYIEKNNNPLKISLSDEISNWNNIQDFVNDLTVRCNVKNSKMFPLITLVTQATKQAPLSEIEYDENMTKIEDALNKVISASAAQKVQQQAISLYKRSGVGTPLLAYHRDTNLSTIQVVINTVNSLYTWS